MTLFSWIEYVKVIVLHLVYASLNNYYFNNITSEISQDPATLVLYCRYFIFVSLIWFALIEKTMKEKFVLNLTNSRTSKSMLSIFDNAENAIVIITLEGYVLFYNKNFLNL